MWWDKNHWRNRHKWKKQIERRQRRAAIPIDVKRKWRRIWLGYGLSLLVIVCVYLSGLEYTERHTPPPRPEVKLDLLADAHDFGRVKQGKILRHAFVVRNLGDKELVLRRRSRKKTEPIRIRPNSSAEVVVMLNTANRWRHTRREEVYMTNDPEQKYVRLTVTALVGD